MLLLSFSMCVILYLFSEQRADDGINNEIFSKYLA